MAARWLRPARRLLGAAGREALRGRSSARTCAVSCIVCCVLWCCVDVVCCVGCVCCALYAYSWLERRDDERFQSTLNALRSRPYRGRVPTCDSTDTGQRRTRGSSVGTTLASTPTPPPQPRVQCGSVGHPCFNRWIPMLRGMCQYSITVCSNVITMIRCVVAHSWLDLRNDSRVDAHSVAAASASAGGWMPVALDRASSTALLRGLFLVLLGLCCCRRVGYCSCSCSYD